MPVNANADSTKQITTVGDVVSVIQDVKDLLIKQHWVADKSQADLVRFWFRGHARKDWYLHPKGLRKPKPPMRAMLHEFRAEATILHDSAPEHDDLRQWLFLMQHHGMPTLLLDWTRSALTALAFALEFERDKSQLHQEDGALWILRPGKWNMLSKATCRYAVIDAYAHDLNDLFAVHFDKNASNKLSCSKSRTITAVEPAFNSRRMIAQQGVFTIHGPTSEPMEKIASSFPEQCVWKRIIPSDRKAALCQELHDLGIYLSSLFPDLDHLSACIKRRYNYTQVHSREQEGTGTEEPGGAFLQQKEHPDMGTGGATVSDVTCG